MVPECKNFLINYYLGGGFTSPGPHVFSVFQFPVRAQTCFSFIQFRGAGQLCFSVFCFPVSDPGHIICFQLYHSGARTCFQFFQLPAHARTRVSVFVSFRVRRFTKRVFQLLETSFSFLFFQLLPKRVFLFSCFPRNT